MHATPNGRIAAGVANTTPADARRDPDQSIRDSLASMSVPDDAVHTLTVEQLADEVIRLRNAIRRHRDSSGHELCWHHPDLWSLLPEQTDPAPAVPEWPQFMRGCIHYRQSLDTQLADAPRTTNEFDPSP